MAIPTYVSHTQGNVNGTNLVINTPASLAVGDLLIAHCSSTEGSTGTFSDSTGDWTPVTGDGQGTASNGVTSYILSRVVDGTEDASYTFVSGKSGQNVGAITHFTGNATVTPISVSGSAKTNGAAAPVISTLTPNANSLCVIFVSVSDDGVNPSGYVMATDNPTWTERYEFEDTANSGITTMATGPRAAATGTGNISITNTGDNTVINFIAISEAPAADPFTPIVSMFM
jgi:hypothetical protein